VREEITGSRLRAEKLLDPKQEVLLRDHQIYIFVVVPAVLFMELAVEAAARLQPGRPPGELRDFHIYQAMHLLKDPQALTIEAEVLADGTTRVALSSLRGSEKKRHAEGIVVHQTAPLPAAAPAWKLENSGARGPEGLYPHRFPNGPIFQVIERMELDGEHRSRSDLRLTGRPAEGCWLPITLLDGAFQVDSATRSGFDRPSGLPSTFRFLRWQAGLGECERTVCLSQTADATTEGEGELYFIGPDGSVVLHMAGITLTSALPATIGTRSKP
jgi:hypothetical protein